MLRGQLPPNPGVKLEADISQVVDHAIERLQLPVNTWLSSYTDEYQLLNLMLPHRLQIPWRLLLHTTALADVCFGSRAQLKCLDLGYTIWGNMPVTGGNDSGSLLWLAHKEIFPQLLQHIGIAAFLSTARDKLFRLRPQSLNIRDLMVKMPGQYVRRFPVLSVTAVAVEVSSQVTGQQQSCFFMPELTNNDKFDYTATATVGPSSPFASALFNNESDPYSGIAPYHPEFKNVGQDSAQQDSQG